MHICTSTYYYFTMHYTNMLYDRMEKQEISLFYGGVSMVWRPESECKTSNQLHFISVIKRFRADFTHAKCGYLELSD